ncbi:MAG: TlyA family RNA methyltransferase [Chloroflexota bacterium]
MVKKNRVDILLFESGLVESRSMAQRLVMAGQVRANGQLVPKPATKVDINSKLTIDHGPRFVSRGGDKLEAAFENFHLDVVGLTCADVGASTGGFTDCLLQHGAAKVYAVDVGHGILHWKMRKHPRVVVMEKTNARYVEMLPEPIDFITIDASFISLKTLLPVIKGWGQLSQIVALIKPQFEAGRQEVARGKGVVRHPEIHRSVLMDLLSFMEQEEFGVQGLIRSPVLGPKGNTEFLVWLTQNMDHVALQGNALTIRINNILDLE